MQVEAYLEAFADSFDLHQYIRYQTQVISVRPIGSELSYAHALSTGHAANVALEPDLAAEAHVIENGAVPHGGAELTPPRWCITSAPAETKVGWPGCNRDHGALSRIARLSHAPSEPQQRAAWQPLSGSRAA